MTEAAQGPTPTNLASLIKSGLNRPNPTCMLEFYYYYDMGDAAYLSVQYIFTSPITSVNMLNLVLTPDVKQWQKVQLSAQSVPSHRKIFNSVVR